MRARVITFGLAAMVLSAGCEAIVSSQVPSPACTDSDPSSCPINQVCAVATKQCIVATASCMVTPCTSGLVCNQGTLQCDVAGTFDAGGTTDATVGKDASVVDANATDAPAPTDSGLQKPYPIGIACTAAADCQSGLCADSAVLGDYYAKTGAVCSVPCCTSEECGASNVCVGPGSGGHYCVPARPLGITPTGFAGGAACSAPTDCRSGQCIGSVCADSCCTDTNCTNSAKCRIVALPAGHVSYACSKGGTQAIGAVCTVNDDCVSGTCYSNSCRPACCGQTSSVSENYGACTYLTLGSDVFTGGLYPGTTAPGNAAVGAACASSTTCKSNFCDTTNSTCSDVCCKDADCAAYGNYICRPSIIGGQHPLICVKGS